MSYGITSQGFHDIVSVLMLVFHDDVLVFGMLEAMCERFFSDYMRKDFTVLSKVMKYVTHSLHITLCCF